MLNLLRLCAGLSLLTLIVGCSIFSSSQKKIRQGSAIPDKGNILIEERITPSKAFQLKFAPYKKEVENFKNRVLTSTTTKLELGKPEGKLNNLVADMLRWHVSRVQGEETDVSYFPFYLLRDSIDRGEVRVEDIYRIVPVDREVSVYRVNGMVLHQIADTIAAQEGGVVSGMRMRIKDKRAHDVLVGSQPIQHDQWYRLAAPSGLFCDHEGLLSLEEKKVGKIYLLGYYLQIPEQSPKVHDQQSLGYGLRDVLIEYLANQEQLNRTLDHRIR